jgi:hypothetical protein
VSAACCSEQRACTANADCVARRSRRDRCSEPSCRDLSDTRNAAGADDDERLQACLDQHCTVQCARWGCVASSAPAASVSSVSVTLVALDSFFLQPVLGLRVRLCNRNDATCSGTTGGDRERFTGPGGFASFEDIPIPAGADAFQGYFEVTDPKGERVPTLVFLEPPPRSARTISISSLTLAARKDIESALGVSPDPLTSIVAVRPIDCAGIDGAGVKLSLDGDHPEVTPFYLDRRLPTVGSPNATTDRVLALAGFAGVPPGSKTVRGRWAANDAELFGTGVFVVEGGFTYVGFSARP